jgi:hypothetical protein
MLSSTTIDRLKNRSRSGLLYTVFVNSGGKPPGFLHQSTRENERDRFDTVVCGAPILLVAACAFSVKQTERSSRKQLSKVKRDVKRFHVNVCHRFRRRAFSRERLLSFSLSCKDPVDQ